MATVATTSVHRPQASRTVGRCGAYTREGHGDTRQASPLPGGSCAHNGQSAGPMAKAAPARVCVGASSVSIIFIFFCSHSKSSSHPRGLQGRFQVSKAGRCALFQVVSSSGLGSVHPQTPCTAAHGFQSHSASSTDTSCRSDLTSAVSNAHTCSPAGQRPKTLRSCQSQLPGAARCVLAV